MDDSPEIFDLIDGVDDITDLLETGGDMQRADMPEGRSISVRDHKMRMRHISRRELAAEMFKDFDLPEPGTTDHYISNAKYDFFNVIVAAVNQLAPIKEFYGSTWTMNKYNVDDLVKLLNEGKIENCAILTGTYFKARESAVYAQLITALHKHRQRYNAFINHTKIVLLKDTQGNHVVFEGSANFTANPRLENYIICNDRELYEFHKEWMEEMLIKETKYRGI